MLIFQGVLASPHLEVLHQQNGSQGARLLGKRIGKRSTCQGCGPDVGFGGYGRRIIPRTDTWLISVVNRFRSPEGSGKLGPLLCMAFQLRSCVTQCLVTCAKPLHETRTRSHERMTSERSDGTPAHRGSFLSHEFLSWKWQGQFSGWNLTGGSPG